jgi:uncharacterized protein (DUF58 family)
VAVHGEDDAATREYRHGDDLRRVHWRSTAHVGELMVRREEQPWESHATIVLDTRRAGHLGDGPSSSFEWGVTAAASVAINLRRNGYRIRLVTGPGQDVSASDHGGEGEILDHLADVRLATTSDVPMLVESVRRKANGGLIVAMLGDMSVGEAAALSTLRTPGTVCIALLVRTSSWLRPPDEVRARLDADHDAAALTLLRTGWRIISVDYGADLADLWTRAARGGQGFAWRAAMAETIAPNAGRSR